MKYTSLSAIGFLALAACATRPDAITPVAISALEYQGMSCEQTTAMMERRAYQMDSMSRRQGIAATADAIGVGILGAPVASMVGANKQGNFAYLKGDYLALERATRINCPYGTTDYGGQPYGAFPDRRDDAPVSQSGSVPYYPESTAMAGQSMAGGNRTAPTPVSKPANGTGQVIGRAAGDEPSSAQTSDLPSLADRSPRRLR